MKIIKNLLLMFFVSNFLILPVYSMEQSPYEIMQYLLRQEQKRVLIAKQGSDQFDPASYIRSLIKQGELQELQKRCLQYEFNPDNSVNKLINNPDFLWKLCFKPLQAEDLNSVVSCLSYLVNKHNLDLYAQNKQGKNIFHQVVCLGKINWTKILLKVDSNILNSKHVRGKTAFLWSAHLGKIEIANFLLQQNTDFRARDSRGWNLFHVLFMSGNIDLEQKRSFLNVILYFFKSKKRGQQVSQMLAETDFKGKRPLDYVKQSKTSFEKLINSF